MTSPLLPNLRTRAHLRERMERPDRDLRWLRRTYRSFRLLNQFYARYRLVLERWLVTPMLAAPGQTYRIADLGSGAGDIAAWLARRCQELGLRARVCGLDNDAQAVAFARERYPDVEYRQQDALAAGALAEFDFVIANHVLHHFSDTELASFLWELGRLPLRGFVLSDLKRSYCAYYAHSVVGLFFPGTYVGVDGRLSLRRGFTVREVETLIQRARLPAEIHCVFPANVVIVNRPRRA